MKPHTALYRFDTNRQRGSSLLEVMIALSILLFVMLGILQLFSMAVTVHHIAGAQTEMTRKAQDVVEVIRLARSNAADTSVAGPGSSGIFPMAAGTRTIPTNDFWGPTGFNIMENGARYQISYEIVDSSEPGFWEVTVTATPNATGYLNVQGRKGAQYAALIAK